MAARKNSVKPGEMLRIRISIPPDGVGMQEYLTGLSPAGLNMEVLQLMHLGHQFRQALSRGTLPSIGLPPTQESVLSQPPAQMPVQPTQPQAQLETNEVGTLAEGASVASPFASNFKTMFAPAFEKTRNRKAVA